MKTKLISLFLLVLFFSLSSCRPTKEIEYRDREVIRNRYDSIYINRYDSIYMTIKGDTVFKTKVSVYYRDRTKLQVDSFYINRYIERKTTKTVTVEKKLSWWDRLYIGLGKLSAGILLILIGSVIVKSYTNPKDYLKNLLHNKK